MSEKFKFEIGDECINFKLKDCGVGPIGTTGAIGTTGPQGTTGAGTTGATGTTGASVDHSALTNLGFSESGHVGFQKSLEYISEFKAYEII